MRRRSRRCHDRAHHHRDGHNLDLKVVAEGIESKQQLDFLRSRDCHYGQGRLFGEPMTAGDFLALLLAQGRGESNYGAMFAEG